MAVGGQVALPNNDSQVLATQSYYRSGGGANGVIALPSREVADEHPAPKFAAGAHGAIRLFQPSISRNNPFKQFEGLLGWFSEFKARYFQPNISGMERFASSVSGATDWTTNRPTQGGDPKDPIRVDARYENYTLRQEFDTRLQAPYWPDELIQRNLYVSTAAASQEKMVSSYFNRLTSYRQPGSYSNLTQVLGDNPS